ncbi:MAG TPA: proton-conducting transporter membrane subunit [Flavobacterium sp.]|nr:proton-conducting transporter membrane subunit [Flavobacterium sp.]
MLAITCYQFFAVGFAAGALFIKLAVVALAMCVNYTFGREYKARRGDKETIQKFAIVSCSLVVGMLATSTNNLLIANMLLDASSMLFAGLLLVGVNVFGLEANRNLKIAFNYLFASALTSVFSYLGSAFILLSTGTYNMQAAVTNISSNVSENDQLLFGAGTALWVFKLLFMLGMFPFHHYVFSASRVLTLPANFFLFTSMKIAPLFIAFLASEMVAAARFESVKMFIITSGVGSIIVASFALYESFALRHFLAASSLSATAFTVIVLAFGGAYPVAVAALNFLIYCITLSTFIAFFVFVVERTQAKNNVIDSADEIRTVGELKLIDLFKIKVMKAGPVNVRELENDEIAEDIFRWVALSRKYGAEFDLSRTHYLKIILTCVSFSLLSMGAIPFTPGFVGKFQAIGLLVHGGHSIVAVAIAISSAVATVWYVMVAFKIVAGIDEAAEHPDKISKKNNKAFSIRGLLNVATVFIFIFVILMLFALLGMQGWFMHILTAGVVAMW